MQNKTIFAIVACVMLLSILIPGEAWIYNDFMQVEEKYDDTRFEMFGPRADRLLIKLYSDANSEWTDFENCQLDLTDWPLTQGKFAQYTSPPLNQMINVVSYGPDFDLATLEINNNNNLFLGDPPDPLYPNPVYPNPCSVLSFRQAIACICDRDWIVYSLMGGFGIPLYTPVVPSQAKYVLNLLYHYPDLCYLYNVSRAAAYLDADGFPVGLGGWRYWDRNGNGVQDPGEEFTLKFAIRVDCDGIAYEWGSHIALELMNLGIQVNMVYVSYYAANIQVKANKDFHLYTEMRWIDTPHPNQLINWHWDFYWHPGSPPNYGGCNNTAYNMDVDNFLYANDQAEAVMWAQQAQVDFAASVLSVPLFCYAGNMAVKRRYSGGEAAYTGEWWEGMVNINEVGPDNYWSFLNMHTQCHPWGDGYNMTIRKGFKIPELKTFNPIYACSLWDHEVLDLIYEPLIRRNPYNYSLWMPWMVKQYQIGTYQHPVYGTCSKVLFTLRPDVYWADGYPVTIADIYFTFKELPDLLAARGCPPPSCWWKEVRNILNFKCLDPCNFEVLFDVKTIWALDWIGNIRILPKHVWKPICTTGDPTAFAPDPNMIGSGPWRLRGYVPSSHLELVTNSPRSTVIAPFAGAIPIVSPGFFRYTPKDINIHGDNYRQKFTPTPMSPPPVFATINFTVTDLLEYREYIHLCNVSAVPLDTAGWNPIGSVWHLPWRDPITNETFKCLWQVIDYVDQHDPPGLSPSDLILIAGIEPPLAPVWVHVAALWVDLEGGHSGHTGPHLEMNVDNIMCTDKYVYLDDVLIAGPVQEIEKPNNPIEEPWILTVPGCTHRLKVCKYITAYNLYYTRYLCPNNELVVSKWLGTWINVTFIFWVTIPEDIAGNTYHDVIDMGTYPYKSELPVPDCKVDIKDLARVSGAFGSYPGHSKWFMFGDITCDCKIDIKDLARVASKFGWHT